MGHDIFSKIMGMDERSQFSKTAEAILLMFVRVLSPINLEMLQNFEQDQKSRSKNIVVTYIVHRITDDLQCNTPTQYHIFALNGSQKRYKISFKSIFKFGPITKVLHPPRGMR